MNHFSISKLLAAGILLLSCIGGLVAQQSFGGVPAGFTATTAELRSAGSTPVVRVLPEFNVQDFRTTQAWNKGQVQFKPLNIGRVVKTSIDFARQAQPIELEYGKVIYRLRVSSPGAQAMTLLYDDFFIPNDGGRLYIYTPDRATLLGAYTYETHPTHGGFANEPVNGDEVIMEYEPGRTGAMPTLQVSGVGYIYSAKVDPQTNKLRIYNPGEDESGDPIPQIGINCPEGAEWQAEKTGVCQLIMYDEEGIGLCSGNLLNNTNLDFRPFIISAAHCISLSDKQEVEQKYLDKWTFVFHYEKPTCSNGSLALNRGKSVVGCQVRTFLPFLGMSDGLLLEAKTEVPESYRVYYNGWDRWSVLPKTPVVGIHHPMGDAKKISIANGPIRLSTWDTGDGEAGEKNAHFEFHYTQGATEGGSSGSSLFSAEHLVVGTLTGGRTEGDDFYGRLKFHWDHFAKGDSIDRMDIYLDPKEGGQARRLEGTWRNGLKPLQPVSDLKVQVSNTDVNLSWAAIDKSTIPSEWKVFYRIYRNGAFVTEITENKYTETRQVALGDSSREGSVVYGVQVRYDYGTQATSEDENTEDAERTSGKSDLIEQGAYWGNAVRTMTATPKASSNGVFVTWSEPANLQEVSLFGYPDPEKMEFITYEHPKAEFTSYRYSTPTRYNLTVRIASDRFVGEDSPTLYAVRLIPDTLLNLPEPEKAQRYTIIVRNGAERNDMLGGMAGVTYEQFFNVPEDWKPGEWVTVVLDKPFKINPMNDLFIGCGITNKDNPAGVVCVKGTNDEIRPYLDGFILINQMMVPLPESKYRGSTAPDEYHAMRFVFAPSDRVEKLKDFDCFAKGKVPVPFPKVKSYKLLKNGKVIAEGLTGNDYQDPTGSTTDSYTVEVVYENGGAYAPVGVSEVERALEPIAYPTQLDATAQLYVENSAEVLTLRVLTVEGVSVMQIDQPGRVVDLSALSAGQYVVVMQTATGTFTQYITK